MQLWSYLLKAHHAINDVSRSTLIEYLSLERVKEVESFTLTHSDEVNRAYKAAILDLRKQAAICAQNIDDIAEQVRMKDKFAELLIFVRLFRRDDTVIKIPEEDVATPDFQVEGGKLYVEAKALNALGGNYGHKLRMEEALRGQVSLEAQRRAGKRVAFVVGSYQPWRNHASARRYDGRSMSYIAESLIEKIDQNIKNDQFSRGPTVLLVDLDQFVLIGGNRQYLAKEIVSGRSGEKYSGILWHAAFGRPGMAMKRITDFDGESNKDVPLKRTGILWEHEYVRGLIVSYGGLFLGLAVRTKKNLPTIKWMEMVCDDCVFVNTSRR